MKSLKLEGWWLDLMVGALTYIVIMIVACLLFASFLVGMALADGLGFWATAAGWYTGLTLLARRSRLREEARVRQD